MPADAEAYEALLKSTIFPSLQRIEGYRGGQLLRRDSPEEVEFIVINFFDSLDAVRRFAGPDYTVAVFEPEAKKLLSRVETEAHHYELRHSATDR